MAPQNKPEKFNFVRLKEWVRQRSLSSDPQDFRAPPRSAVPRVLDHDAEDSELLLPPYELDAVGSQLQILPPSQASSSPQGPIRNVSAVVQVSNLYLSEPFLVPFNLYSYNAAGYQVFIDFQAEQKLWRIPLEPDVATRSKLCTKCQKVGRTGVDSGPYQIMHWDFVGMTNSVKDGCCLCTLIYTHGLDGRPISQIKAWYRRGQAQLWVRPSKCELEFVLDTYRSMFELYRSRDLPVCKDDPINRRDVPLDPLSGTAVAVVSSWLQKCQLNHTRCARSVEYVPTRLIDVEGSNPNLVHMDRSERVAYIALSHCWGSRSTIKTTRQNIEHRLREIPMSELPSSFRDAVLVTRALGLRYLWIDSLCIIQDSKEDWLLESEHMRQIYQNSFLTISALDSVDSYGGFLHERGKKLSVPLFEPCDKDKNVFVRSPKPQWNDVFESAPLNKRAWTLQERLLSTRILHYSNTEMFWECFTCSTRESSVEEQDTSLGSGVGNEGEDFKRLLFTQGNQMGSPDSSLIIWHRVLQNYTARSLTRKSDKLAAIAGIVSVIAQATGFTYRYGLWEEDIKKGLLWTTDPYHRSIQNRNMTWEIKASEDQNDDIFGPSWTWTCANGKVIYDFDLTLGTSTFTNSLYDIQLLPNEDYGSVIREFTDSSKHILSLRGIIRPLQVITIPDSWCIASFSSATGSEMNVVAMLDLGITVKQLEGRLYAIWILEIKLDNPSARILYLLLVVPNEAVVGTYRRVGVGKCTIWGSANLEHESFEAAFQDYTFRTIQLA